MGPGSIQGTTRFFSFMAGMAILLAAASPAAARRNRIQGSIDGGQRVALTNHVHPKAVPQQDQGPVDSAFVMEELSLMLAPSPEQQADLDVWLVSVQDPGSAEYRNWLTPEQFASRFAVSPSDMAQITAWLRAQGFSIRTVAPSRNWVAFSGTAGQVRQTFQAEIHRFQVEGAPHYSNIADPSVPAALSGVITSIRGLNDFGLRSPRPVPAYTAASGNHYLTPDDLATIYNLNGLRAKGYDGTGQNVAIVGQSAIDLNDIRNFRSLFGLPTTNLQVVLVPGGTDPGIVSGDDVESDLDLEWAGAAARNAGLIYVYARNVMDALQYAVSHNLAPVIGMSYGSCETAQGGASMRTIAQQANAQGITWIAASGDSGAAGCESQNATVASHGLAVNLPASIPEVTGVGGTTFQEGSGTYWGANGGSLGSVLSYIPETSWNDTSSRRLAASGGGVSEVFGKPSWQAGPGVPADNARDVPDVAMAASPLHDGAIICIGGSCASGLGSTFSVVGGTSLSTPVFAGITALLNHYLVGTGAVGKSGLGNLNPVLYGLAQTSTDIFHDVTTGNNVVPCRAATPNCTAVGSLGYQAGPGYDLVTGLGSVNAYNLVTEWGNFHPAPAALSSVTITPATVAGGATATLTVSLTSAAPAAGAIVTLSSSSPVFPAPPSLTVPAGQFSASVPVLTTSVTASTPATVTATYNSVSKTATVNVVPVVLPTLTSVTVTPATVAGGASALVRVTLSARAPENGAAVTLASTSPAFPVPASLTVRQGRRSASVLVQTTSVTASTPVTVTATYNSTSKTANVTVAPVVLPTLTGVAVEPSSVAGGASASVSVSLSSEAPPGGVSVTLSSSNSVFPVPATLTVPSGRSSASVEVQTKPVNGSTPVTVIATYNSVSKTANVTVAPVVLPTLTSVAIIPISVRDIEDGPPISANSSFPGGTPALLTITLSGEAPPGGAVVTLSSSAAAFPVPASVTVRTGRTTESVIVETKTVTASTPVTVTATYNSSSKTATATLTPVVVPTLASLSVSPSTVDGGGSAILTITLTGPAPPGGSSITLTSSNPAIVKLMSPAVMPAGWTSGRLRISTARVSAAATITITAAYNSSTQTAKLTVNPGGGDGEGER